MKESNIVNITNEKVYEQLLFTEYEIKGTDNNSYNITIFLNAKSISFYVKNLSDFERIIYKNEYTLYKFYDLNRFFRQYLTLEEMFTYLFKNLKQNELKIIKSNSKITLFIVVEIRGHK